ncbi:MAG: hypothetical protein ACRCWJ_20495 [Casimicrobium sp.]
MRAPVEELQAFTGYTQAAAIVRRLRELGAPAIIDKNRQPAVPDAWWQSFQRGDKPLSSRELTQSVAANDSENQLNLAALPSKARRKHHGA